MDRTPHLHHAVIHLPRFPFAQHVIRLIPWRHYSKKLPASQFLLLNAALGIGHIIVVLGAGAFLPILPNVAASLGRGVPYAVWGQSDYVAAMAAAFLIARPLMRRYGAKRTALGAYVLFAVAGFAVIASLSVYPLFTAARTVQGFAAGASIAPSLALLLEQYKGHHHRTATSLWALATFMPFSVGPALGGYFAYVLGDWRLMFVTFSVAMLLVAGIIWALTGNSARDPQAPLAPACRLFVLFAAAALAIQELYNVAILSDMTTHTLSSWWIVLIFLLLGALFWIANAASDTPLIRFSLFRHRNYAFGLAMLCIAFTGIQGSLVQYVLRIQSIEGYTAWHAGLLFLPIFVLSKPMSLRAHYWIHHGYDPRLLACAGAVGFAASFWWMGETIRPATWEMLLWPQLFEGAALGVFITAMNAIILANVPPAEQIHAVDVINTARTIAAAWIIAMSDVFWDRYADSARNYLISPDTGNLQRWIADRFPDPVAPGTPWFHELGARLTQQAGWLTFNAMFHTLAVGFAAFAALIWLASARHISHRVDDQERIVESLGEDL